MIGAPENIRNYYLRIVMIFSVKTEAWRAAFGWAGFWALMAESSSEPWYTCATKSLEEIMTMSTA